MFILDHLIHTLIKNTFLSKFKLDINKKEKKRIDKLHTF